MTLERRDDAVNEGRTLVGQDKKLSRRAKRFRVVTLRFTSAPGAEIWHGTSENIARVYLSSGTT